MGLLSFQTFEKYFEIPSRDMEVLRIYKGTWQGRGIYKNNYILISE